MLEKIKISGSSTRKSKANHKFKNNFKILSITKMKTKIFFTCTKIYPSDAIPSVPLILFLKRDLYVWTVSIKYVFFCSMKFVLSPIMVYMSLGKINFCNHINRTKVITSME